MKHILAMVYAVFSHVLFGVAFVCHLAFLLEIALPVTIRIGDTKSTIVAIIVNVGIIAVFGIQHSVMARPAFKKWLPIAYERSTFVVFSSLMLLLITFMWQPISGALWQVDSALLRGTLHGVFFAGVSLVLLSIIQIDYLSFFGLKQAYQYFAGKPITDIPFRLPLLYRLVRHPLMVGLLMMYWITPHMTAGRLLLCIGMTAYIFVGLYFEERDLTAKFGDDYRTYQQETPMLIPTGKNNIR